MKLKKFIGKDVRGYMEFDINFRESLTFLIGINGSGKTTVLKLISGLLAPSYLDLSQIEFSNIELTCNDSDNVITISCKKKNDEFELKYEDKRAGKVIKNTMSFINQSINRRGYNREMIDIERINRSLLEFEEQDVVHKIRQIKTPLFLGLNRRITEINGYMPFERDTIYRRRSQNLDMLFDSVDVALNEIQEIFFNNVRENARSQYAISDDFRKKVFSESFKVEDYKSIPAINYADELSGLEIRRQSLNTAIDNFGLKDLSMQFTDFFNSIKTTLETLSKTSSIDIGKKEPNPEYVNALLRWMVNSSQIEKIDKIIQYGNIYSNSIQQLKEPITRFLESVNLFFKEGHKKIEVDDKGEIIVKIDGYKKRNSIFELSSGEKQLIVMMAHLSFHKENKRSIFVIDEPELSLHISWQEIFVDALLKASPNTQFILATHAPAILAKNARREFCEDLSNLK